MSNLISRTSEPTESTQDRVVEALTAVSAVLSGVLALLFIATV